MNTPLCKDCAHMRLGWVARLLKAYENAKCSVSDYPYCNGTILVSGIGNARCATERGRLDAPGVVCGRDGKAFKPIRKEAQ